MSRSWEEQVVDILCADTTDLRELARLAGADPSTFYLGARLDGVDLRGQDLRGLNLEPGMLSGAILDETTIISDDERLDAADEVQGAGLGRGKSNDLAMLIGSGTTQIFTPKRGLVLNEGSVVALRAGRNGEALQATGNDALRMVGREPGNLRTVRPIESDLVADPKAAELMIRSFLEKSESFKGLVPPRVVLAVPSSMTPVQRRGFRNALSGAGIRQVLMISRSIAAAVGASVPARASIAGVIDLGDGSTDVGIFGPTQTIAMENVRIGLSTFDNASILYLRRSRNLMIGEVTAQTVRTAIGRAGVKEEAPARLLAVTGRDLMQGVPREIEVSSQMYAESISGEVAELGLTIAKMMQRADAHYELNHSGFILTGPGAEIPNMATELSRLIGVPVTACPAPSEAVVRGIGVIINRPQLLKTLTSNGGAMFGLLDL